MRIAGHDVGELTAEFVRRFGDLTEKMRLYTEERAFDDALAASIKASSSASS